MIRIITQAERKFSDQPFVASFPHFTFRPGNFTDKIEGMRPDPEKHSSYIILEPTLGVPLNQRATSQSNIVTKDLSSFKADIARFSNMVIPLAWLEYVSKMKSLQNRWNVSIVLLNEQILSLDLFQKLEKITPVIVDTVDFIVNILPKIQYYISALNIFVGLCLLILAYFCWSNRQFTRVNGYLSRVGSNSSEVRTKSVKIIERI